MALFKSRDKDNKSFQFMHCWNILRNQPKWHEKQNRWRKSKKFHIKSERQMWILVLTFALKYLRIQATVILLIRIQGQRMNLLKGQLE
jgi:hypothetical protein